MIIFTLKKIKKFCYLIEKYTIKIFKYKKKKIFLFILISRKYVYRKNKINKLFNIKKIILFKKDHNIILKYKKIKILIC